MTFKLSVMNATKLILDIPINITIRECFYHFCPSTYRKLQEIDLSDRYKKSKDDESRKFCYMIDSLAFLSLNEVTNYLKSTKTKRTDWIRRLLLYFETTYVNGLFK